MNFIPHLELVIQRAILLEVNLGNRLSQREFNILQKELKDKVRKNQLR